MQAQQAPLSSKDRGMQMLNMFQKGMHEDSKPKPKMSDLMKMTPQHSQSMSTPSASRELDQSASAFSSSTSRVYDVFTALVEEDLGIKVSEDAPSKDAGPTAPSGGQAAGASADAGWGGDGSGAGDDDFGDFEGATADNDDEFGEFEATVG
eukprot:2784944-Rhodomonas_salina.1